MKFALLEAQKAFQKNEVPVGAVIVHANRLIGRGHNSVETLQDATAHAEMMAIQAAEKQLNSWRLDDAKLYVTLEPCSMCAGAILLSRIDKVVFGAHDPRYGACGSVLQIADNDSLDVRTELVSGVLEHECSDILKQFFRQLRQRK